MTRRAAKLENQLAREMCEGHVLFGKNVTLIARANRYDDAIFLLLDDSRVAQVHLAWQGRQRDPRWPATVVFSSLAAWITESMIPWHQDWTAED